MTLKLFFSLCIREVCACVCVRVRERESVCECVGSNLLIIKWRGGCWFFFLFLFFFQSIKTSLRFNLGMNLLILSNFKLKCPEFTNNITNYRCSVQPKRWAEMTKFQQFLFFYPPFFLFAAAHQTRRNNIHSKVALLHHLCHTPRLQRHWFQCGSIEHFQFTTRLLFSTYPIISVFFS